MFTELPLLVHASTSNAPCFQRRICRMPAYSFRLTTRVLPGPCRDDTCVCELARSSRTRGFYATLDINLILFTLRNLPYMLRHTMRLAIRRRVCKMLAHSSRLIARRISRSTQRRPSRLLPGNCGRFKRRTYVWTSDSKPYSTSSHRVDAETSFSSVIVT